MDETKEKYRKLIIDLIMKIEDNGILIKIYTFIKHS